VEGNVSGTLKQCAAHSALGISQLETPSADVCAGSIVQEACPQYKHNSMVRAHVADKFQFPIQAPMTMLICSGAEALQIMNMWEKGEQILGISFAIPDGILGCIAKVLLVLLHPLIQPTPQLPAIDYGVIARQDIP